MSAGELERFASVDWLLGRPVKTPVVGVGDGVAPDGALRLRLHDGRRVEVRTGPVELADAPLGA